MATSTAPTETAVKIGDPVAVSRYNSKHEIINSIGFVTGIDYANTNLQGPNGEPAIGVIVVDNDNAQKLGAAQYSAGLLRLFNVVAQGSKALENRTAVAAYDHEVLQLPNLLEAIEPAPANPVFERIQTPEATTKQDAAAAVAVQAGKIAGSAVSPSVAEAVGQTGAETIPATNEAPAHAPATPEQVHAVPPSPEPNPTGEAPKE